VTYSDVMSRFALSYFPLLAAMGALGKQCRDADEPIITSLIVDKTTGRCSPGLFGSFNIDDDELERQRCYAFWGEAGEVLKPELAPVSVHVPEQVEPALPAPASLEERCARFAQVEVRTRQAAFRRAVFMACGGQCVLTGCDVPEALEAAHLLGRTWRAHNEASDGILLRRDLHTLYDRGLLAFDAQGTVELDAALHPHYGSLQGRVVAVLASAQGMGDDAS
jgi:hypothetical protein